MKKELEQIRANFNAEMQRDAWLADKEASIEHYKMVQAITKTYNQ